MLDYLITSRARRELLRRLWLDGDSGNVSALARLFGTDTIGFPALQQFNAFASATMVVSRED